MNTMYGKGKFIWLVVGAMILGAFWGWAKEKHAPIVILSDRDFTPENGVIGGSGTVQDPYVIAGWKIDRVGVPYGIYIRATTAHFLIKDVEICGAQTAGIKIEAARNGKIEDVEVAGSTVGIMVALSRDIWIEGVRIRECDDGIRLVFSRRIHIQGIEIHSYAVGVWLTGTTAAEVRASLIEGDLGILLELGSKGNTIVGNAFLCRINARSHGGNTWDEGGRGNFWLGFDGPDADGDGIVDVPYFISPGEKDHHPLAVNPWEKRLRAQS
ncbi:MAG TPA: hypothetical protein ENF77_03670 [Candidatus Acetothermia bacterium]|nr:hypothetical protein [Candidatus Acetothermia bacterium]